MSTFHSDSTTADKAFFSFIEHFSTDSAFQKIRTEFPLEVQQFKTEDLRDTIIFIDHSDFEFMDLRKKKSSGKYEQWKSDIVIDESNTKATIEIRGIDNGIYIDYCFQKKNGKWMLVRINDGST